MPIDVKDLELRVLSAVIIAPVVLLAVYVGGPAYAISTAIFSVIALWEWMRLSDTKAEGDVVFLSYAALLLTVGLGAWETSIAGAILGAALVTALYFLAEPDYKERTKWIVGGLPYVGGFALSMLYIRGTPSIGMGLVFYLLAVVWGTDVGGYAAGRIIGGPKLAPSISPKKTWAGFLGGVFLAGVAGYIAARCFGAVHPVVGLFLALVLAVFSQAGDLFESWIKRRANVKESSHLIPGHGGILDRIDGLIFAAIAFAIFQTLFGVSLNWW